MTQNSGEKDVGSSGHLIIRITQVSQDPSKMTSRVLVEGIMFNAGSGQSTGDCTGCWINGDQVFNGDPFHFSIPAGQSKTFISHTFTCGAGDRGNEHVNFQVNYEFTGTGTFGNGQNVSAGLDLDRIKTVATAPQNLRYSGLTPTSLTLDWDPPDDDGGYNIQFYIVKRYNGSGTSGNPDATYQANASTRFINDLVSGQDYTFTVQAINKAQYNGGYSIPSDKLELTSRTGVFMRHNGTWVRVQPYIRNAGVWSPAQTLVRSGSLWKPTNN